GENMRNFLMTVLLGVLLAMPLQAFAGQKACLPDGEWVNIDVVTAPEDMARGLSGRLHMPDDSGMLFAFAQDGAYPFWMKDMLFNLDICWIAANGNVTEVHDHLPPCTPQDCPVIRPATQARYVLEINAGQAARHGVKPGSHVALPK